MTDKEKPIRPVYWTNPITLMGLLHVAIGLVLLLSFWLFMLVSAQARSNQYLGIVGFCLLPGIFVTGLVLCPIGIVLRKRRIERNVAIWHIPTSRAVAFLTVTFFLVMPVLGVSGYQGYEFTDSAEFCGAICHNMYPQYVRYQQSPHARVTCAGCHIGPGPGAFVKAKVSGAQQLVSTFTGTYPIPVPPAITELRPARETCEQCHWPSQFFGSLLRKTVHFAPDEKNTRHDYEILVKVGGLNNSLGQAEGIHMHMLDKVEYVADDPKLEHIPWVSYRYPDGKVVVFRSDGKPTTDPPPAGKTRLLDCIDCHNVAGHKFLSPEQSVDHALAVGQIDTALPFVKREAVRVLSQDYQTKPQALAAIRSGLNDFYKTVDPSLRASADKAVDVVCDIYQTQFFPEFKVDWRTYPNHLGHMESPGCFRCHDGMHISAEGKRISSDCTTCHTFQYRQPDTIPQTIVERRFDHPLKINDAWNGLGPHEGMLCTDCHDGGLGAVGWKPGTTIYACGDCHPSGRWLDIRLNLHIREAATQPATKPSTH
ncbi:MAG: NapC/NirT family cytochrome c [Tepidisphaeraceae bacterium]|jgi:nitrate/TMAO reductase-like tetraheme cytochrome c subunit